MISNKAQTNIRLASALGFFIIFALGICFLFAEKFTGAEFIAFVLGFSLISIAIGFANEIQELSIAGNVVKLREVKAEAVAAIESLNESRSEMISIFLDLALKHGGGFATGSVIDPRNKQFWRLVGLAKKYQCLETHRDQIAKSLHILMVTQIRHLQQRNDKVRDLDKLPIPHPLDLSSALNEQEGLKQASARNNGKDLMPEIREGLEEYLKLDQLRAELGISRDSMKHSS